MARSYMLGSIANIKSRCEFKDRFEQINLNLKEEAGLIYGQVFPSLDGSR